MPQTGSVASALVFPNSKIQANNYFFASCMHHIRRITRKCCCCCSPLLCTDMQVPSLAFNWVWGGV